MIQEQVLNKILSSKDSSLITLNNLGPDYFSDYINEFNYIKNHLEQYSVVPDMETFLNKFPEFDVFKVAEPDSFLLEELQKDKNKRFLAQNYSKVRQLIMDNKVDEAMSILKQASEESYSFTILNATNLFEDTSRFDSYADRIENYDEYFIKTGFPELDRAIGGWNRLEDLVTIVARNGVGKSWVLFKCASAAAKAGKRVGIYSGEMSTDSVGYRIDTMLGHISNGALVYGGASVKNQYKNYLEKLKEEAQGQLWVITPKDIGGFAKPSTLRAFVEKYNLDILFIDQYSLMLDDQGSEIERIRYANISTGLKLLQTTKKIPVIAVAQQNREKLEGDKAFDTTQIMGCDMIGQNSSNVLFLERKDDLMRIYLGKLRQSKSIGKFLNYRINLNEGDWTYVPEEGEEDSPTTSAYSNYKQADSNGMEYTDEDVF